MMMGLVVEEVAWSEERVKFLLPCFLLKLFSVFLQDPVLKDSYFMKQITLLIYGSVLSLHYELLVFIRVQCFVFDGEDVR